MNQSSTDSVDCHLNWHGSCWGPPDYEHEEKQWCVLHFPSEDKEEPFRTALEAKIKHEDFNFAGAFFPGGAADLWGDWGVTFGGEADFSRATFSGKADFREATFCDRAHFESVTFRDTTDFGEATFKESARFYDLKVFPRTALVFRGATMEKPERIFFHRTYLRPSWFVDVGAQKFDFSDVEWFRIPDASEPEADKLAELTLEEEIETLVRLKAESWEQPDKSWNKDFQTLLRKQSLRELAKSCRNLMNNAEENRDYPTANEFHYWSMEAQRKEGWSRLGVIATLYWTLSGYGERPLRAFGVPVGIWLAFTVLFLSVNSSPFVSLSLAHLAYLFMGSIGGVGYGLVSAVLT